jgi:hypothetical protein
MFMKQEYAINSDGMCIGRATVIPAGLYYDIACRCKPQSHIIRIVANCGGKQENIGICVPQDGEMVIRTKIPQKRLQSLSGFVAITEKQDEWVPITEGKPMAHLDQLIYARFSSRNGKPGLAIPQVKQHKNPQV